MPKFGLLNVGFSRNKKFKIYGSAKLGKTVNDRYCFGLPGRETNHNQMIASFTKSYTELLDFLCTDVSHCPLCDIGKIWGISLHPSKVEKIAAAQPIHNIVCVVL